MKNINNTLTKIKIYKNQLLILILVETLLLTAAIPVYSKTTKDKIKETGEAIESLEEEKKAAEQKADSLETEANSLEGELKELNTDLKKTSDSITETEGQITAKQGEIDTKQAELEHAIAVQEKQYADMKLRIRFMYENGQEDLFAVIMQSESVADILNRAEYIKALTQYDRDMLDKYEEACNQVEEDKTELEGQKTQMEGIQANLEDQKDQLDTLVQQTASTLDVKQGALEETQESIQAYEDQIAKMKEQEAELEKQAAAEEAKRLAAIKKQEEELAAQKKAQQAANSGGSIVAGSSDVALLAAIIECEAGGEIYEGKLAVGSVVLNRVRSSHYPNTISGVIYQSSQFTPVASGRFALVLQRGASAASVQAANEVLGGNITIGALCFRSIGSGMQGTVIGNQVFF